MMGEYPDLPPQFVAEYRRAHTHARRYQVVKVKVNNVYEGHRNERKA